MTRQKRGVKGDNNYKPSFSCLGGGGKKAGKQFRFIAAKIGTGVRTHPLLSSSGEERKENHLADFIVYCVQGARRSRGEPGTTSTGTLLSTQGAKKQKPR